MQAASQQQPPLFAITLVHSNLQKGAAQEVWLSVSVVAASLVGTVSSDHQSNRACAKRSLQGQAYVIRCPAHHKRCCCLSRRRPQLHWCSGMPSRSGITLSEDCTPWLAKHGAKQAGAMPRFTRQPSWFSFSRCQLLAPSAPLHTQSWNFFRTWSPTGLKSLTCIDTEAPLLQTLV